MTDKVKGFRGPVWLAAPAIFTLAFAVRMLFVYQVKASPYWRVPLVDAMTYDGLARNLLETSWLAPLPLMRGDYTPYFQPPLYQTFLALIYLFSGGSVMAAVIIQYLIGSLTCVLAYFVGRRFFSPRVGIVVGIAMALTASHIYYEGRLLPPVLMILLNLAVLLLAAKQLKSPAPWRWPVIGLLLGLSAITRPDILLFVPMALVWMWIERRKLLPRQGMVWAAVVLLCASLPVGLVSLRNAVVGRDFTLISWNGGVNFFLGNHPNMERMIAIRPGIEWEMIIHQPLQGTGFTRPSQWSAYYYKRGLAMMLKYKRITLRNLFLKAVWVWRGQETGLNTDEYYLTRVSPLYRMLLWRKGNFGFPFGVIAPLGLLGMLLSWKRRRELFLLYSYVAMQTAMMVVFFPTSRYRMALVPILLMFGAVAVFEILDLARRKRIMDLLPLLGILVGLGILSTLYPPKYFTDARRTEAENYRLLATALYTENRVPESIAACMKGVKLAPNDPELHKWLLDVYFEQEDYANAEKHAREVIRLVPQYGPVYTTLIRIYEAEGKPGKAAEIRETIEKYRAR